ncbi:MAG: hypothetical protein K6G65_03145 [Lachnospiraceae bacterium]|nr:hypothetical protein [Lachnospiraceae bacterium]
MKKKTSIIVVILLLLIICIKVSGIMDALIQARNGYILFEGNEYVYEDSKGDSFNTYWIWNEEELGKTDFFSEDKLVLPCRRFKTDKHNSAFLFTGFSLFMDDELYLRKEYKDYNFIDNMSQLEAIYVENEKEVTSIISDKEEIDELVREYQKSEETVVVEDGIEDDDFAIDKTYYSIRFKYKDIPLLQSGFAIVVDDENNRFFSRTDKLGNIYWFPCETNIRL